MKVVPGDEERSRVYSSAHLEAETADPTADRECAANGIDGRLEQREDTITRHLDASAVVMVDLRVDGGVVLAEEPIPCNVSESSGMLGRSDDVGDEDRAVDAPRIRLSRLSWSSSWSQPAGRLHQEVEQEVARLPGPITVVHVTGSRDEPEPRTGDAPRHPPGVQR